MSLHSTILIIGGTSGIGASFARALHAQGKTIIVTGRRSDRLAALSTSLPGLHTACFDITSLSSLPTSISNLTTKYPDIDTVIVAAGIQSICLMSDPESRLTPSQVNAEVTTNLVAPMVLAQLFVPFFLVKKEKKCSLIFLSSGVAFVPPAFFPIYAPTKAGLHSFCVALRSQFSTTNIKVVELLPPYVATELDSEFKGKMAVLTGGRLPPQMPVDEFTKEAIKGLEEVVNGQPKGEVPVGDFPTNLSKIWRDAFSGTLQMIGSTG